MRLLTSVNVPSPLLWKSCTYPVGRPRGPQFTGTPFQRQSGVLAGLAAASRASCRGSRRRTDRGGRRGRSRPTCSRSRSAPCILREPGLRGHVGERAVAVVVIQDVVAVAGDEEVVEAVVVVVADGDRRCPARARQAGLLGDVGEGAVAVVPVETIGRARAARPPAACRSARRRRASRRCRSRETPRRSRRPRRCSSWRRRRRRPLGCVRPASRATSVKRARNGRPDGLPRGCGLTPREEMPWANALRASRHGAASRASICRRVSILRAFIARAPVAVSGLAGRHVLRTCWTTARRASGSRRASRWRRRRARPAAACRWPRGSRPQW